jgi:hypothetical protein
MDGNISPCTPAEIHLLSSNDQITVNYRPPASDWRGLPASATFCAAFTVISRRNTPMPACAAIARYQRQSVA